MRMCTWARVVACLGMSRAGEPGGREQVIRVIRGPKGRRMEWVRAVRRERSRRWVSSMVVVVVVLDGGDVVLVLGSVSREGVSGGDSMVFSVWDSFLSSMVVGEIAIWEVAL
jgi:hypothetical protein